MPQVKLFANLRTIAETKELPIAGSTLGGILNELVKQIPALDGVILEHRPDAPSGNGQIRPHFVITINGHNTINLDAPVTEQDLIAIFPPIAGG